MNKSDKCDNKRTFFSEIEARKERGWAETEHKRNLTFIIAINVTVGI